MESLSRRLAIALLLSGAALGSGCATITGSESQNILVATHDEAGSAVAGAECRLTNNNGSWSLKSPGTASVRKSADDLLVRCELEERAPGTARVVSRMNAGMVGNVIFGGAVGAVIDHTRGTAYDYPNQVRIVFGRNRVVEADDAIISGSSAPAAAAPPPAPRAPGRASMEDLDGLLKEK